MVRPHIQLVSGLWLLEPGQPGSRDTHGRAEAPGPSLWASPWQDPGLPALGGGGEGLRCSSSPGVPGPGADGHTPLEESRRRACS